MKSYLKPFFAYNGWFTLIRATNFLRAVAGNVYVVTTSILLGGFLAMCTASVLAGLRKRWHRFIYNTYLLQAIIPGIMIMLPLYIILAQGLNLYNSYWSLILLFVKGGAVSTMIFTGFYSTIPKELKESVQIDGGGFVRYFLQVLMPNSSVPFATYTVIHIPWFWNNLLFGLLFLRQDKYTVVPMLNNLIGEFDTNFQTLYAGLAASLIPMIMLYLIFQKLFIKSAMAGAMKY